jgi:hypothetical protein
MRERFLLSKHGESITPESAADGDVAERWTEIDREPATLRDVVEAFRACEELSCSPVTAQNAAGMWGITAADLDYRTGTEERYSYHVMTQYRTPVDGRTMLRILRLAGHA